MKWLINTLVMLVAFACTINIANAHPGHSHDSQHGMRLWHDVAGHWELEASFVREADGCVELCLENETTINLPVESLSTEDLTWIDNRVEQIRKINEAILLAQVESPSEEIRQIEPRQQHRGLLLAAVFFVLLAVALGMPIVCRQQSRIALRVLAPGLAVCLFAVLADAKDEQSDMGIQSHFEPFKSKLKYHSDADYFYVESNGIPDHRMMVGITAWQQQVPIPQAYSGANAWRIPLKPKLSDNPVSAKKELFRGAIALAVNGVPIFNPIKNDGRTDTYLAGELDEFGGHCGRADDYHYHIAPIHLEKVVGKGKPIAYALDGFPLYGYLDSDGKEPKNLDEFNGRTEKDGYRYYSTKKYPYINGGLRGVVTVKDDQIDPQPRAYSPRPALTPLRGAKITGFTRDEAKKTSTLKYEINGKMSSVSYSPNSDGGYTFVFTDSAGKQTTETYRSRPDGKRQPPKKDNPPPKKDNPPAKKDRPNPKDEMPETAKPQTGTFRLSSPAFEHGGKMPTEFTGDGDGISPPLKWTGAPAGTKFYALQLWHKPRAKGVVEEIKSYWVITNIPADVTNLVKNTKGVGKDGYNDKKRTGYDPMNSKGPGVKEYHITMYALSAEPKFEEEKVTRVELLRAIKGITLAESTLSYTYERKPK